MSIGNVAGCFAKQEHENMVLTHDDVVPCIFASWRLKCFWEEHSLQILHFDHFRILLRFREHAAPKQ